MVTPGATRPPLLCPGSVSEALLHGFSQSLKCSFLGLEISDRSQSQGERGAQTPTARPGCVSGTQAKVVVRP